MPSTHKATLADFIPGLQNSQTRGNHRATYHHQTRPLSTSATVNLALAHFDNLAVVHSVRFVPDVSFAANATNYYTFQVINKGVNGTGATQLGSTVSLATTSLTAFVEKDLYAQATPNSQVLPTGSVLAVTVTATGAPAAISGTFIVDYSPVIT